jgi:hypothetical protein
MGGLCVWVGLERWVIRGVPSPDATLGDGDGAARLPYLGMGSPGRSGKYF